MESQVQVPSSSSSLNRVARNQMGSTRNSCMSVNMRGQTYMTLGPLVVRCALSSYNITYAHHARVSPDLLSSSMIALTLSPQI